MNDTQEQGFSSSWNSASSLMFEIAKLRANANSFYSIGRYQSAINSLICIQQTTCSILNSTELSELDKIEEEFFNNINIIQEGDESFFKNKDYFNAKRKMLNLYNNYNRVLMIALQSHDLLLSAKTDITRMKA